MDGLRLGDELLNGPLCGPLFAAGNRLFYLDAVRKLLVRALDRRLVARIAHLSPPPEPCCTLSTGLSPGARFRDTWRA